MEPATVQTRRTTAASIGWPMPWWGLIAGGGFVALMASPAGAMPGFIMIWMVILMAAPFMIVAGLVGGSAAGYVAGGLALAVYVLGPAACFVVAILKAGDRRTRGMLLNRFVLFLLFLAGAAASVRSLAEAWP